MKDRVTGVTELWINPSRARACAYAREVSIHRPVTRVTGIVFKGFCHGW
jgi:hypothetical protein